MIRHRGILLARVRDQRLVEDAFAIWGERLIEMRSILDSKLDTAINSRSIRLMRSALEIWQENVALKRETFELAIVDPSIRILMSRHAIDVRTFSRH